MRRPVWKMAQDRGRFPIRLFFRSYPVLRAGLWAMLFAALWSMAAAPAAATDAKAPPSLESYGALPALDHMNLSPGGKFVSYLLASGDDRRWRTFRSAGSRSPPWSGRATTI